MTETLRPPWRREKSLSLQLAFEQMIDFFANGVEIIQSEINDRVTDISDLIHFLQTINHQVTDNT